MYINVWHTSVKYCGLEFLPDIWEWVKRKLTTEEIKILLLTTDGMGLTFWHVAVERGYL